MHISASNLICYSNILQGNSTYNSNVNSSQPFLPTSHHYFQWPSRLLLCPSSIHPSAFKKGFPRILSLWSNFISGILFQQPPWTGSQPLSLSPCFSEPVKVLLHLDLRYMFDLQTFRNKIQAKILPESRRQTLPSAEILHIFHPSSPGHNKFTFQMIYYTWSQVPRISRSLFYQAWLLVRFLLPITYAKPLLQSFSQIRTLEIFWKPSYLSVNLLFRPTQSIGQLCPPHNTVFVRSALPHLPINPHLKLLKIDNFFSPLPLTLHVLVISSTQQLVVYVLDNVLDGSKTSIYPNRALLYFSGGRFFIPQWAYDSHQHPSGAQMRKKPGPLLNIPLFSPKISLKAKAPGSQGAVTD